MSNLTRFENEQDYKKIPPQLLYEFRQVGPTDPIYIPEVARNRKCTNIFCLLPVIIILVLWIVFAIMIMSNVETRVVVYGVDDCGNVCGMNNVKTIHQVEHCVPKDYTDYPINEMHPGGGWSCVKTCEKPLVFNRCIYEGYEDRFTPTLKALHYYYTSWKIWLPFVAITIAGCILLFLAYRFFTAVTYWVFQMLTCALLVAYAGVFWYITVARTIAGIFVAIGFTICLIVYVSIIAFIIYTGRYKLIIGIIAEASIAVFKIPALLVVPLISMLIVLLMYTALSYIFVGYVLNAITIYYGEDFYWKTDYVDLTLAYHNPGVFFCYVFFASLGFYLVHAFINGLQCMVVAGSVATYYFTKDKLTVSNTALVNSFYVTVRYHLGTVAAGSIVITTLSATRGLTHLARYSIADDSVLLIACYYCLLCCICLLEEIAQYFAKRAYMMTAMHGKGLLDSGIRAARLLWHFLLDTVMVDAMAISALNTAGVWLYMTILAFIPLFYVPDELESLLPMVFAMVLIGTTTFFYISILNVAVSTLFLCICEDKVMNNGSTSLPYFMSKSLAAVMIETEEMVKTKQEKRRHRFSEN